MSFIPIFDAIKPVVDKVLSFIPDPQEREKQQEFLVTALKDWDSQQTAIDAAEAANSNLFVSGWRPALGWTCALAFAYKFVLQPFLVFGMVAAGSHFDYKMLPTLDWSEMSTVMFGMLGLGGMRTLEKIKKV